MKKNKMLRMASALLVLTLLTTSIIGNTLAKYTTRGSAGDSARVAKFGAVITTSGSLYSDAYAKENAGGGNLPAAWTAGGNTLDKGISVAAILANDNIVAPGTHSYDNGLSFSISGEPEVAVRVKTTITAEDIFLKDGTYGVLDHLTAVTDDTSLKKAVNEKTNDVYAVANDTCTKVTGADTFEANKTYYVLTGETAVNGDYYPVEYTLNGTTNNAGTGDSKTAVGIAGKLAQAVASSTTEKTGYQVEYSGISQDFAANTDLSTKVAAFDGEKVTWKWDYGNGDRDGADTILGDLIAAREETNPSYKVVSIESGAVTPLTISKGTDDYTVKNGGDVVANLRTKLDIALEVTQID